MAVELPKSHAAIKEAILEAKVDSNIRDAAVREWTDKSGEIHKPRTTGPVLAMNDHFVAHSTGKNYVTVHERALMADSKKHGIVVSKLEVGQSLSVFYYKGAALLSPANHQADEPVKAAAPAQAASAPKARAARPKKAAAQQEAGPAL